MMRIAYIINSVEGGGAAAPVPAITRVMRDQGAAVRVFALTRRDGRALPAMEAAGLDPLVRPGGEHDHVAALRWLARETAAWGATHLWTSLTRATILGLLLARRRGLPAVSWQHAAYLKTGNRLMLRALQSRARLWVADSTCVADLTRRRLKVPPERMCTWPIFAADAAAPVATPWQPGATLRIGSLGRLHRVKGYDVLIEALARLRRTGFKPPAPFEVVIAGEGKQRAALTQLIESQGLSDIVRLPGFAPNPREFLAGLHLYVQPSRSEGFCIAAHEAMQAGLPVIASRVGEMPNTIMNGTTGMIVSPGAPDALAAALEQLLASPERLAAMGSAARTSVLQKFSAAGFAAAGAAIIERIRN
jgi:glycosyltransferase involved in cell wall biosynthesis